jgi:hypothetical protein
MSRLSDELGSRLALVVPEPDAPDWDDVLARAELFGHAASRPRRRSRLRMAPRALIFAIVVVLMGGSLALAVGDRVLHALGDGPAPTPIKHEFRDLVVPPYPLEGAPPLPKGSFAGKIIKGSERRVLAVKSGTHVVALYAARASSGDVCFVTAGWPVEMRSCGEPLAKGPFVIIGTQRGSYAGQRSVLPRGKVVGKPIAWQLVGRARSGATRVRIVYADGTHHDLPLANGGWFMYSVPAAHTWPGAAPIRFDVLSATGARLGTRGDPFALKPVMSHFAVPTPASIRLLERATLPNGGGTVAIWIGRTAAGHQCFRHLRNGTTHSFPVWWCMDFVGAYGFEPDGKHAPVQWDLGLVNEGSHPVGFGYAYATGWVAPTISRLTVRFQGGASSDIPLHEGFFLYVVPPAHWPAGHRPSILEARAPDGRLVYRRFLYPRQHCIYPGRDPVCRNLDQGTG